MRTLTAKQLDLAAREAGLQMLASASNPTQVANACNQLGVVELRLNRPEAAADYFERGLAVDNPGDLTLVKLESNRAIAHLLVGELDEAWKRAERAGELRAQAGELPADVCGNLIWTLAYLALLRRQWEDGLRWGNEATRYFEATQDTYALAHSLNNLGIVELERGRLLEAENYQRQAMGAFESLGPSGEAYKAYAYTGLGQVFYHKGDLARTAAYAGQALRAMWSQMGLLDKRAVAEVCELHGLIAWAGGDRRESTAHLQRASTYYLQRNLFQDWARVNQVLEQIVLGQRAPVVKSVQPTPDDQRTLRYFTSMLGFLDSLESLHPQLAGRSQLVTRYALVVGEELGFGRRALEELSHAARLYDVGFTSLESDDQAGADLSHTIMGERLLRMFSLPTASVLGVRHHHERFDGQGGPDGLVGEAIPIFARIIAVADAYVQAADSYAEQPRQGHSAALDALARRSGGEFDPDVVSTFIALHRE